MNPSRAPAGPAGPLDRVIAWSIANRLLVVVLAALLVALGVGSMANARLDLLPDFTPPQVVVQTEAAGLGTREVEELVTSPVERALLGTPGLARLQSTSSAGLSVLTLTFDDATEVVADRHLTDERLALAASLLPDGVGRPQLVPVQAPIGALLKLCLTSDDPDPDRAARELRTFADWTLRPRLLAVPGVAQVSDHGGDVERIEVRPDPVRMLARGVALQDLEDAVRDAQSIAGGGTVDVGASSLGVASDARLDPERAAGQIADVVVAWKDGLPTRVSDVADVAAGAEPRVGVAMYDGKPAVYVQISKIPWADTVGTTERVEAVLAEVATSLPEGVRIEPPVFRQADFVETSIRSVTRAMLIGSLLVVAVLIAFLRHPRLALISCLAIPLSILAAVSVLVLTGTSIDGMTLGGLAIAVGEVVDDAIVDVENVWRRLRENARRDVPRPADDVIRDASSEIRGSVVYATMIVMLVLVPVLGLGGISGRIFAPLALAYLLAIAASLAVALVVTPALCALLLPRLATPEAETTALARALVARYRRLLDRAVERPRLVLGGAVALTLAAVVALPFLGGRFLPEFHEGSMIGHVYAVPGTSLAETARLVGRIDARTRPGAAPHVSARVGRAELDEDAAPPYRAEIDFVLPEDVDLEDAVHDLDVGIAGVPGLGFAVEGFFGERVHEVLSGETAPIAVEVLGPDLDRLRQVTRDVGAAMAEVDGLEDVHQEPQVDVPQIVVEPLPGALGRWGVRPRELAEAVATWRQGTQASQVLFPSGRLLDVVVAGPPELRDLGALPDLPIATRATEGSGGLVPLSAIARLERVPAPSVVSHENGERRIVVDASASGASLAWVVSRLEDRLAALELPKGYRVVVGGEAVERNRSAGRLLLVGAGVLVGIFALLSAAFGSGRDAAIVLVNLPLGLVGGVAAASLLPEGLSTAGFVGFVTLFGIIARNGVMLVTHHRQLDEERPDLDAVERVKLAAEERLLPIVMTAATAGLGLLPLALSLERQGSELEAPMAVIVLGGLATSTALNMVVLPTLYVALARRRGPVTSRA